DLKWEDVEAKLMQKSIEELEFFPLSDKASQKVVLKNFPNFCAEARYLYAGEKNEKILTGHDLYIWEEADVYFESDELSHDKKASVKKRFSKVSLENVLDFKKAKTQ